MAGRVSHSTHFSMVTSLKELETLPAVLSFIPFFTRFNASRLTRTPSGCFCLRRLINHSSRYYTDGDANHASALAFELLRGPPPELHEFLRIKFKNGTNEDFQTYPIFGHKGDLAVTEFLYRLENFAISSQKQWESACGINHGYFGIMSGAENINMLLAAFSTFMLAGVFALSWFKRRRSTSVPVPVVHVVNSEKGRLSPQ
ncbi:hypothetical protein DEU56DRAFT_984952 [Suillus clintonianus]|uniref:uncharacterized protein n=1 Tax=Suillus clintonianus TaxID=1904413 RepID=UPI001B879434|nr:uncharacterized protein DEU56DRAFT_984952 [Suillus clintonianus]KAG2116281.1 hypothetical protein DEU56DRAFT_984952 [Suillus clintonianus]